MPIDDIGRPASLHGWGRTAATTATVMSPRSVAEISSAITRAGSRGVIARGLGRSYGDAAQNSGGLVVDTTRLDRISLDPVTGLVTAEAGASLDAIMRVLLPQGWFVPVTPGTRSVTVGGAVGADIHGKNHHVDGSFGTWVRSLLLVGADGTVREVAGDFGNPLFAATIGGMGLTGVVAEVTFQAIRSETAYVSVLTRRAANLAEALELMRDDNDYRYTVAWIDLLARGETMGRSVLTLGNHLTRAELPASKQARASAFAPATRLSAPPMPSGLLNPLSVRAFNELWYRKAPRVPATTIESIGHFFHPLDGVADWNRLYGRAGLMQYQFVVPLEATAVLRGLVERLNEHQLASFLAVLKRFGPGSGGYLSFPTGGWTLAVDLPVRPGRMAGVFDEMDREVAAAGGRIYLAKDAVMRRGMAEQMYPDLEKFRAVRADIDPSGVFVSDQSRRLGL
ncbi:FAD-binding oxidoreductase [Jatrophihabitans sp.]|uniref:FAD-binding oxidoreductase n=1 Tax=Jatrophihabitans sp. TaxID=1932789 RepID=UPI0030C678BD|nr:linked oxidase domain protein [Jatrophihabitans sp.]